MSDRHNNSEILAEKYAIKRQLASKGGRKTLLASNIDTEELVVIKLLTFGNDISWDDLKLFEREAETLKSISHPAIPRYVDYFELDGENNQGFALVQTHIDAPSLEEQLQAGRSFSESEIKQLAQVILDILDYLHSRQPAIIHRDIKPSNILLGDRSGNSVGDIYLVDFGSVQNLATKKGSTITIVGTYGYMPPEQFGGRAKPASDLYSLGATLIYILTGQHPADLFENNSRIKFEHLVNISPGLISWLKKVTEPNVSERFTSVKEALDDFNNSNGNNDRTQKVKYKKPIGSRVLLTKTSEFIEIIITNKGLTALKSIHSLIIFIFLAPISLLSIIDKINYIYIEGTRIDLSQTRIDIEQTKIFSIVFFLLSIYMLIILVKLLLGIFGKIKFKIDNKKISLQYHVFGISWHSPASSYRGNITSIEKHKNTNDLYDYLIIWAGIKKYEIVNNSYFALTSPEINWLTYEISQWLNISIDREENFTNINFTYNNLYNHNFYYNRSLKHIENDNNKKALHDLNKAIEINPKFPEAYQLRAAIYLELDDYKNAMYDCNIAIELNKKAAIIYQIRGVIYIKLQDHKNAISDFKQALELGLKEAKIYSNLGLAYYSSYNYQSALQNFSEAIKIDSNISSIYYNRSLVYINQGDYEAAIKDCDRAIELDSNNSEAYNNRGGVFLNLNNYQTAIDDFDKAIEIDSNFAGAYGNRGSAYLNIGNYQKAVENFSHAIKLDSSFIEAYYSRGLAYLYLQEYQVAIKDFDRIIDLDANYIQAYGNRGLAHFYLKEYQTAIENFDYVVKLNPKSFEAYFNRGLAHLYLENYQSAIEEFDYSIELNSNHKEAYVNRGLAYLYLQEYQLGIEDCNQALILDPQNAYIYKVRGDIYYCLNSKQEALNDFQKRVELAADSNGYYDLGTLQYFLEMYSDAMESFSSCLKLNSQFKFAYYNRANLNYDLGNQEAAVKDFNQAIALEGQTDDKLHKEDEHSYYARGLAKWRFSQDIETAIQDLEKAAKIAEKHQYKAFHEKITATIAEIQK